MIRRYLHLLVTGLTSGITAHHRAITAEIGLETMYTRVLRLMARVRELEDQLATARRIVDREMGDQPRAALASLALDAAELAGLSTREHNRLRDALEAALIIEEHRANVRERSGS